MFFDLILYPITLIYETLYKLFCLLFRYDGSAIYGIAIIGLSFSVSLLTLPLYNKAEKWQKLEREIKNKLKPKLDDIKAVFKGDERLMITSTYYKQNKYHPIYALRGSIGLLLQIPFFIAAYIFISNLKDINGASFIFIHDLSKPDALLWGLNLLPIVMTLLNFASALLYTKGFEFKEKIQLYAIALLFLLLLYNSPSALVLYWTCNNLISLIKNILVKIKKPFVFIYISLLIFATVFTGYMFFYASISPRKRLFILFIYFVLLLIPLVVRTFQKFILQNSIIIEFDKKSNTNIFYTSTFLLFIVLGLTIPSMLISSSPQEFSYLGLITNPLKLLWPTAIKAFGLFILWPVFLFYLFNNKTKRVFAIGFSILSLSAILNIFIFKGNYGLISLSLQFDDKNLLLTNLKDVLINVFSLISLAVFVFSIFILKKDKFLKMSMQALAFSLLVFTFVKVIDIEKEFLKLKSLRDLESYTKIEKIEPIFSLSKTEQNVFVLMLDKATGALLTELMENEKDIIKTLDGFVYYPNTVSMGSNTLLGVPSLYGGHEYSVPKINARTNESLVAKHNEALSVLPLLFLNNNWETTIVDAPLANYNWRSDNRIFSEYKGLNAFNTKNIYTDYWKKEHNMYDDPSEALIQNLFNFSLFKSLPPVFRYNFYDDGDWMDPNSEGDPIAAFVEDFSTIYYLKDLFAYDSQKKNFIILANETTHEFRFLSYPDYFPANTISNYGPMPYESEDANKFYSVFAGAFKYLAQLFLKMQEEGVWDNTRIIIVADHGAGIILPVFSSFENNASLLSTFNPLLLYKDFNARGPIKTDYQFSSNADVPYLATKDLVPQINPHTGSKLRLIQENEKVQVITKQIIDPRVQRGSQFDIKNTDIALVKENIFDPANWEFAK